MQITVEREPLGKLTIKTPNDSSADDMVNIFKTVMIWLTFTEDIIKDVFKEE